MTSKPWFGPKKYVGWGWRITSREGWLATVTFAALLAASIILWPAWRIVSVVVLVVLYFLLVLLTGERPGGPPRRTAPEIR